MSDSKGHGKKRWGKQNPSQASPAAGLSILKLDGSNFVHWKEAFHNHLLTKYGSLGQFIQTEALYQRP
jgi:hypothetical protein